MKRFLCYAFVFIMAVIATSVVASVFSTQMVIGGLKSIDVDVPLGLRLLMTVEDLGILAALVPAVAACFIIAFPIAGLAWPRLAGKRLGWFVLAGLIGMIVELLIIEAIFDLMPIAGARTYVGLLSQGLAGACGGGLFAAITESCRKKGAEHA